MKKLLLMLALPAALSLSAVAQEPEFKVLAVYYPDEMVAKEHLATLNGQSVYKFENTNDTRLDVRLIKIFNPRVSTNAYAIAGKIKYDTVQGAGYLEMWNFFPPLHPGMPEGQYFTRTLGDSGEMGKITGTCDWRDFTLPFDPTGASGPPTHLEINLILPGRGTVYLKPVKLLKYSGGFSLSPERNTSNSGFLDGSTTAVGWWSPNIAPWVGGIGGPAIGFFGGVLGWLSQKGKARQLVLVAWRSCIVFGISCLIATVVALIVGQPWFVSVPLLVFGFISTLIFSVTWPAARNRYDELEIRRMASMDATGS